MRRRKKRNLNYRVCPINTRIIRMSGRERERKKSKSQEKKVLTIIASLSRFYYIVYITTTTLVYICILSVPHQHCRHRRSDEYIDVIIYMKIYIDIAIF